MLRELNARLRERGVEYKSRHRRDSEDPFEVQRRLLAGREVETVLDCGAHHGRMSAAYRRLFPRAEIFAFEPTPASFEVLERAAPAMRVIPVAAAVADDDGELEFHTAAPGERGAEQGNSLLAPPGAGAEGAGAPIRVRCVRLDTFCAQRGIGAVGVLKLDVEGAELAALRGASDLLGRGAVDVIMAEFRFEVDRPGAATFLDLGLHLRDLGYHVFGVYGLIWEPNLRLDWGDAIWVSDRCWRRYTGRTGRVVTVPAAAPVRAHAVGGAVRAG